MPNAATARFPRTVFVFPRLAAGVAGFGHCVPAPQFVARAHIQRRHPAARATVARAVLNQHLAVGHQWCSEKALLQTKFILGQNHFVPQNFAVVAINRDHPPVRQIRDDLVFPQRDAARNRHIALMLHTRIGNPHELAAIAVTCIDLVDRTPAVGGVHISVIDQRIHFALRPVRPHILHAAQCQRPHHAHVLDVIAINLREA